MTTEWKRKLSDIICGDWVCPMKMRQNEPHFCRWLFQINLFECRCFYFYSNFTIICSQRSIGLKVNIVSVNDSALNRWQAIFSNNDGCLTGGFTAQQNIIMERFLMRLSWSCAKKRKPMELCRHKPGWFERQPCNDTVVACDDRERQEGLIRDTDRGPSQ